MTPEEIGWTPEKIERYNRDVMDQAHAEIERLKAELAAAKQDSERYRYLKNKSRMENYDGGWSGVFIFPHVDAYRMSVNIERQGIPFDYRNDVDAAIDAAMAKEARDEAVNG